MKRYAKTLIGGFSIPEVESIKEGNSSELPISLHTHSFDPPIRRYSIECAVRVRPGGALAPGGSRGGRRVTPAHHRVAKRETRHSHVVHT